VQARRTLAILDITVQRRTFDGQRSIRSHTKLSGSQTIGMRG